MKSHRDVDFFLKRLYKRMHGFMRHISSLRVMTSLIIAQKNVCIGYMQCVGNIKTTNMSSMWNINRWGEPCCKIFSGIRQD